MVCRGVEVPLLLLAIAILWIYLKPLALFTSSTLRYAVPLHPSLSETLIPAVDTAFVKPLLAIDAARLRYVDIRSYDWADMDTVLTELGNLSAMTAQPRPWFSNHLGTFVSDTRERPSLRDVRSELGRVPSLQGWNISVGALCEVCGLLKDAVDVVQKESRKELHGFQLIKFKKATAQELRRDLIVLQGVVRRLRVCASQDESIMASLVREVKKIRRCHTWYPIEIFSWAKSFLFGQGIPNFWTCAIEAIVEQTMGNLTATQKQRRVRVIANQVQRFEWQVQAAIDDLHLTVQELSKLSDVVKKVADKELWLDLAPDLEDVAIALERVWKQSRCSMVLNYACN